MNDTQNKQNRPFSVLSYVKPRLPGGSYTISVKQKISLDGADDIVLTQQLDIDAPRFTLDPKDIHSLYPAPDAAGVSAAEFPYIVFTKRTLPWERLLSEADIVGSEDSRVPIPWLALIVFTEGEVSETFSATVNDYLNPEPADAVSAETLVPLKTIIPSGKAAHYHEQHCQYIEISLAVFKDLMPRLEELPFLAHVREVDMDYKADVDMPRQGVFSTIIANRLPLPGRRSVVHLVSVEGCESLLGDDIAAQDDSSKSIRLLSLASWSFKCDEREGFFRDIVGRLTAQDGDDLRLALPAADITNDNVRQRLKSGYVPLAYHLMSGENSFAWYRGPLIPAPDGHEVSSLPEQGWLSASAAMRFDSTTGAFDQSYAAAWQLGRSLALADPQFGPRLMGLRRKAHQVWDEFCDLLFFQNPATLTTLKEQLGPKAKDLVAGGVPDLAQVDSFLDQALNVLNKPIELAADQITSRGPGDLLDSDLLQISVSKEGADLTQDTNASGMFDLVYSIVKVVQDPLKDKLGSDYLKKLSVRADFLADIFKLAISKLVDRAADGVLKIQLSQELEVVYQWMENLSLTDIPLHYLIAHPKLLPPESLRFFYLDDSWWYALFDGAASLGIHSSMDEALYQVMRKRFLARRIEENIQNRWQRWGFMLRSELVRVMSGTEFYGFEGGNPVQPLLTRKLGDELILFLFAHMPDRLELREGKEGLRFGVDKISHEIFIKDDQIKSSGSASLTAKYLSSDNKKHDAGSVTISFRNSGATWTSVLDVKETIASIQKALTDNQAPVQSLTSAHFALQLFKSPARLVLEIQ